MADVLPGLSEGDVEQLPLDRLALVVLEDLVRKKEWSVHNYLNAAAHRGVGFNAQQCLSETLTWLLSRNLIARNKPGQSGAESIFVTRLGTRVLEEGPELLFAGERLEMDVHPRLQHVRSQFLLGQYELAAFAAMREVEIRVRELAGADSSLIGVKLMREAFREQGVLADPDLDPGERVGIMDLFAGAIGTFKNPPSHRQVDYTDPTEASEVVMLADLLMRLLERVAARLGREPEA